MATSSELKSIRQRLERYQAALRLASTEIESRNKSLVALTNFAHQATRIASVAGLLKLALTQALETIGAQTGAVVLIDSDSRELTLATHRGLTDELTGILTGQQFGASATALMPHLVAGLGALLENDTQDEQEKDLLTIASLSTLVSLPLQFNARLHGAMVIGLQKGYFKPVDLYFLMGLTQEIAVAMENMALREDLWQTVSRFLGSDMAPVPPPEPQNPPVELNIVTPLEISADSLHIPQPAEEDLEHLLEAMMMAEEEVQQQNADLQTLNTIIEMLSQTLNLSEILDCAVKQTTVILKMDATWIYLLNDERQLELHAHTGLSSVYVRGMQMLKIGDSVEGKAIAEQRPRFVDDITQNFHDHKIWVEQEGLRALAAVPIVRPRREGEPGGSNFIGVLATGKRRADVKGWNPREMRLLTSVASQVALAIENARLYARLQENEAGMRAGNEVLRTVNDMLIEKNVSMEGYIHNVLRPGLAQMADIVDMCLSQENSTLTRPQQDLLKSLQKIAIDLDESAQHADQSPDMPIPDEAAPPVADPNHGDTPLDKTAESPASAMPPTNNHHNHNIPDIPLTFEEAVKAGLVPDHIAKQQRDS